MFCDVRNLEIDCLRLEVLTEFSQLSAGSNKIGSIVMQAPKLLEAQNTYMFQYTNDGEERWISWPTYLNLLPLLVPSK